MTIGAVWLRKRASNLQAADVEPHSLAKRVRSGAFWIIANTISLRLVSVLSTAVVARIVSPRDFGVFGVATACYTIVYSIGQLGVTSCLIRADLDIDNLAPTIVTVSIVSNSALAGAMIACAHPIAALLGSATAAATVKVMAIALILAGIFAVSSAQMVRDFRQREIFLANGVSLAISTFVLIALAKMGSGALAFAWSMVVNQLVRGAILFTTAPRRYRLGFRRTALRVVLRFAIPLAGANLVQNILLNVDYLLVGHLFGAAVLGIYFLAFNVATWQTGLLGGIINVLSVPTFSRVKGDADRLNSAVSVALRAVSLVAMPMCGLMMALAHPLMLTLYGKKWAASGNVLLVLALYGAIFVICLLLANIVTAFGRTRSLFVVQVIWLGILILAMILGVHEDGVLGVAYAHVAVIVLVVLPSYLILLRRTTGLRFGAFRKAVVPALVAAAATALAARVAAGMLSGPAAQLVGGLVVGGVIYVLTAGRPAAAAFGWSKLAQRSQLVGWRPHFRHRRGRHRAPGIQQWSDRLPGSSWPRERRWSSYLLSFKRHGQRGVRQRRMARRMGG